jgi:class 3 adenylate cyclase
LTRELHRPILLTDRTHGLLTMSGDAQDLERLGEFTLRGREQPLALWAPAPP